MIHDERVLTFERQKLTEEKLRKYYHSEWVLDRIEDISKECEYEKAENLPDVNKPKELELAIEEG